MICLTGDLHHASLCTGNQEACDKSEIRVAQEFLSLLEEANVNVTFFISGKAFEEEWGDVNPIASHPLVEVGGHNYRCFKPELWHRFWKKATGSYPGPEWYERRDIEKTIDVIEERTGKRIRCWRNHMYLNGPSTRRLLAENGITLLSDGVQKSAVAPIKGPEGLWEFPINIIPDHEHLYHAERTPEWVAQWVERYNWSDDFGSQSYYIGEWTDLVLEQLEERERSGAVSNLIIHPITMYLCDRFESFKRILSFIASRETKQLSEVVPNLKEYAVQFGEKRGAGVN